MVSKWLAQVNKKLRQLDVMKPKMAALMFPNDMTLCKDLKLII